MKDNKKDFRKETDIETVSENVLQLLLWHNGGRTVEFKFGTENRYIKKKSHSSSISSIFIEFN